MASDLVESDLVESGPGGVGPGGVGTQTVMVLISIVTAPLRAKALPQLMCSASVQGDARQRDDVALEC